MSKKQKYYVVWKGRKTGVFLTWEACALQINGFPNAEYKSFESQFAAEQAFTENYQDHQGKKSSSVHQETLLSFGQPNLNSYAVDASCRSVMGLGPVEYQCVHVQTKERLFRQGPFQHGTNNIGEFLAIVQALELLKEKSLSNPIYSDSITAIAWVRQKKCNTKLQLDDHNQALFDLIKHAEQWLQENDYSNAILKWETEAWGENPADYDRK
jgi:ribonuclease HI